MKKLISSLMKPLKMHGMKYSLLLGGVLFLLSGCSSYQYLAVAGNAHQNKEMNYVAENDTAKIVYSFKGPDFPVTVEVYNKLNKPIYVDWTKSALIIDGRTLSYWQDVAKIKANTNSYTIDVWDGVYYSWGELNGTITKYDKVSFVPPDSYVKTTRFHLKHTLFDTKSLAFASQQKESFSSTEGQQDGKRYIYNKQNSPFSFKSYITLSTDKDFSKEIHFNNTFWVKNILQTAATPKSLKPLRNTNISGAYVGKAGKGGLILGYIAILGATTGAEVLTKSLEEKSRK